MANLEFNPKLSTVMHLDLNSCFASIEQQANPFLRGKPVAVAAYTTASGCIVAPSVEAKKYGVKVGMRVKTGKLLCPGLVVLAPDPWKYRSVHLSLRAVLSDYTDRLTPKSIDEFVLNLEGSPVLSDLRNMFEIAGEIKTRIKKEVGEWLTVSIGISTNRFLAKTASGLHKPDGLDEINKNNFKRIYSKLALVDLCGIKLRNASRLNSLGIYTVVDFYEAPVGKLKSAFNSILGYYWYLRLRGFEIDDVVFARRSYGNSFALPVALSTVGELSPILSKLVEKTGARLRKAGWRARGVHLSCLYRDGSYWHKGVGLPREIFDSRDIYKVAIKILSLFPHRPVRNLAVSVFNLIQGRKIQLELFDDLEKKERLVGAIDKVNERFGSFVLTPANNMLNSKSFVADRIAFGGVKELEEFTNRG